jgi:unsaturated chondroitin disaccharide hydrolase
MPIHSGQTSAWLSEKDNNTDQALLSDKEMQSVIELLIHRMEQIDSMCDKGFPLYSPGIASQWIISPGGSWMGGFWSAWWWLRSRITGSTADQRKASAICQRLSSKLNIDSINRSFIFWHGASLGDLWFGDDRAHELATESIIAIAATYDPEIRCIPLGTAMGGGAEGNRRISIDSLAALIQLFSCSEHYQHQIISQLHTDTILTACCHNGAFHPTAHFNEDRFQATDEAGAWSRGQAWGMLGLCRAAALWGEPYLTHAQSACEYWRNSRPNPFPQDRLNNASELYDPSSSVIASLAMLSLADSLPDGNPWRLCAHQTITAIIHSQFFSGFYTKDVYLNNKFRTDSGIFWGSCYRTNHGKEELVETAWGSFFLMAALCILAGAIQPNHC